MKEFIKNALKIVGHALTVSVHERLDHVDHALDLIIDQNNRMARTQTALLQSSIHMVNSINRVQADLAVVRRGVTRTSGRADLLVEAVDRALAEIGALKLSAENQKDLIQSEQGGRWREAFFQLYSGLPRLAPGSDESTRRAIHALGQIPKHPRIIDAGCGTGAQTMVLAKELGGRITAVDTYLPYLEELAVAARREGLDSVIEPRCLSMDALDEPAGSVDLIWSEGAVYQIGVSHALKKWYPLLRPGGRIAFTEITWIADNPPEEIKTFWTALYESMGDMRTNCLRATQAGYEVVGTVTLPSEDWWRDFYTPLRKRCSELLQNEALTPALREIVAQTEEEIRCFERFGAFYGYVFYLLSKPE